MPTYSLVVRPRISHPGKSAIFYTMPPWWYLLSYPHIFCSASLFFSSKLNAILLFKAHTVCNSVPPQQSYYTYSTHYHYCPLMLFKCNPILQRVFAVYFWQISHSSQMGLDICKHCYFHNNNNYSPKMQTDHSSKHWTDRRTWGVYR